MAKLVLIHDVPNLGQVGDVVEVKDGYARNYLIPRRFAQRWTRGAQVQIDQMQAARRKREIATIEDARAVRDTLQAAADVMITKKVGANGRLFGAVTTADIAEAVKTDLGQSIDRRKIHVASSIKSTGQYQVVVDLHPEVNATFVVRVVGEK